MVIPANTQKEQQDKNSILQIIQTLLPAVGVFAALLYFLGRLYLEAYYRALGVSPASLVFNTNDYMFSSFNLIIMCLVFCILFYIYWEWLINPYKIEYPFKNLAEKLSSGPLDQSTRRTRYKLAKVLLIFLGLFALCALYFIVSIAWPSTFITGFSGLVTGFGLGVFIITVNIIFNVNQIEKTQRPGTKEKEKLILCLLISVVVIFSVMPIVTEHLAMAQAHSDLDKFPIVETITKEALPDQLQDGSTGNTNSVAGRLILSNNNKIYISRLDDRMGDIESNLIALVTAQRERKAPVIQLISSGNATVVWRRVYAIPTDSISEIIYISIDPWKRIRR